MIAALVFVFRQLALVAAIVIAVFLLSMLAQAVIKLVIEWWFSRESHRVLMVGWSRAAQNPNL